jgi:hypothetical protein
MKKVNRLRKRMEQNKRYFIPSLVLLAAMGAGVYGVSSAGAQVDDNHVSMIERIATKFNLNKDEVQKVFEEERIERQKNMQENFEKRLTDAVTKGDLTEVQKNLIIAKKAEIEAQRENIRGNRESNFENLKSMTAEERKAEMEKRRAEMKAHQEEVAAWAKENGINVQYLPGMMGGHEGGSRGFHGDMMEKK